ncbi:MAG: hypothetical protein PUK66_03050 [Bacteroidales bacterium]|uniref:hypothetical protein n=1 Tax=Porphyromonas sp. TaxID=1924944 RepID=UPI002978D82C|nr:hypothetical protein [Porphyromonas sp.]MDD7437799.1 hypothetical protein [Bacteroidales bacterium]MDY3066627.1 hypothetical protein [Porphyromonas sp.]
MDQTLSEILGDEKKPRILAFNKVDAFTFEEKEEDDLTPCTRENISLEELKQTWMAKQTDLDVSFISARTGQGIEELKQFLYQRVREIHSAKTVCRLSWSC